MKCLVNRDRVGGMAADGKPLDFIALCVWMHTLAI